MAIKNNIYYNAAFIGFYAGLCKSGGLLPGAATEEDFSPAATLATTLAAEVDQLISNDALVSVGGGNAALLADTTTTIQANEYVRPDLLRALCEAAASASPSDNANLAPSVVAAWTEGLETFVVP